ncbi:hypothetical protein HGP28_03530 [Vibrio sp. SM6]|uniref:Uncharacterized protein n=1 Tax=Vibrio agarilyticus TaxID=2726741 RepID=A0A7X8TNF6_9VIBR|nr:hypothetical protein [Vibrio agarilyticus]NLS11961.1 hypothetical protein [Vibrio agarilyticus]
MHSESYYYAAFSAALMAGAEPKLAQKIGYHMAYFCHNVPPKKGLEPLDIRNLIPSEGEGWGDDKRPFIANRWQEEGRGEPQWRQRRPINPLHHVDWLKGGVLNLRGRELGRTNTFGNKPESNDVSSRDILETVAENRATLDCEEVVFRRALKRLNEIIQRSLSCGEEYPSDITQFCSALYDVVALLHGDQHASYWLMVAAVDCYLWGKNLAWSSNQASLLAHESANKPMYASAQRLQTALVLGESEPLLWQCLMDQLHYLPRAQQIQCVVLGIAYRAELIDLLDEKQQAHRDWLNITPFVPQAHSEPIS